MKRIDLKNVVKGSDITVFQMEGHKYVANRKMILRSSQIGFWKNYDFVNLNATLQEKEIKKALNELNEDVNIETDIPEFVVLPGFLKYLDVQTPAIVEKALVADGTALRHVKDKNLELCKIAVTSTGQALRYVPASMQNEEICMVAILKDNTAIHMIKRDALICRDIKGMVHGTTFFGLGKSNKMVPGVVTPGSVSKRNFFAKVLAVEPLAIKHMHTSDETLQKIAVTHNIDSLRYINNPSRDVYIEAINVAKKQAHA